MLELAGQAIVMFVVTNIDDLVLLALFFGRPDPDGRLTKRIVVGQYLGFGGILLLATLAAFGLRLFSPGLIAYLGLLPIALGVRAAVQTVRDRGGADDGEEVIPRRLGVAQITAITFANGGDNVGVYVPVFASAGFRRTSVYAATFLVLLALWCLLGRYLATRPPVARMLARWGDVLLPVVLVTIGVVILVEGGAFTR